MLMSPDSSSADPDPYHSTLSSTPSMIQVPECTQSHGTGLPVILKQQIVQNLEYKKVDHSINGFTSPAKAPQPVYPQKIMGPKSDEDLNLGKEFSGNVLNFIRESGRTSELLTQFCVLSFSC